MASNPAVVPKSKTNLAGGVWWVMDGSVTAL
jgi:hypothetical protein